MPTINKRFLLKLVLVVVAFTGTLFGVHAVQADRIPAALRRQAERSVENGKTVIRQNGKRYLESETLEFRPLERVDPKEFSNTPS